MSRRTDSPSEAVPPRKRAAVLVVDATTSLRSIDHAVGAENASRKRAKTANTSDVSEAKVSGRDDPHIRFTARDVLDFGANSLTGKSKQAHDREKLERIGAKAGPNQRVPYKMLMGMKRKEKERETNRNDYRRSMGMKVHKTPKKARSDSGGPRPAPTPSLGRFKGGVLNLSKRDIADATKTTRKHVSLRKALPGLGAG